MVIKIEGTQMIEVEEMITGNDMASAISKFKKLHPETSIEFINNQFVVGFCKNTKAPVFQNDTYERDGRGFVLIKRGRDD